LGKYFLLFVVENITNKNLTLSYSPCYNIYSFDLKKSQIFFKSSVKRPYDPLEKTLVSAQQIWNIYKDLPPF